MAGYNVTCFAYGMTGAGKTHTIVGDFSGQYLQSYGICYLAADEIFKYMRREISKTPNISIQLKVSYLEIYNEQVRDLLSEKEKSESLMVVEDP